MPGNTFVVYFQSEQLGEIEIAYRVENFKVNGDVYFRRDDFGAVMEDGEFKHPFSGLRFKLHVPPPFSKRSLDCVLDVLRWASVGRSEPRKVVS
jgi:hypothetical protein